MISKPRIIGGVLFGGGYIVSQLYPPLNNLVDSIKFKIFNTIDSVPHLNEAIEFEHQNFQYALLTGFATTAVGSIGGEIWDIIAEKRNFRRKNYRHMLGVPVTWIDSSTGELTIKNEMRDLWENILPGQEYIKKVILKSASKLQKGEFVIPLPKKDAWMIYGDLRDNPRLFTDRENAHEEAAKGVLGVKNNCVEFIGMLTLEPQYTIDSEENHAVQLHYLHEEPYTKALIRLSMYPKKHLEEIIEWCEKKDESMNPQFIGGVMKLICKDTDDRCRHLDALICHLLRNNPNILCDGSPHGALKFPTYRKKILTMVHVAKAYKEGKPSLKIGKNINLDSSD